MNFMSSFLNFNFGMQDFYSKPSGASNYFSAQPERKAHTARPSTYDKQTNNHGYKPQQKAWNFKPFTFDHNFFSGPANIFVATPDQGYAKPPVYNDPEPVYPEPEPPKPPKAVAADENAYIWSDPFVAGADRGNNNMEDHVSYEFKERGTFNLLEDKGINVNAKFEEGFEIKGDLRFDSLPENISGLQAGESLSLSSTSELPEALRSQLNNIPADASNLTLTSAGVQGNRLNFDLTTDVQGPSVFDPASSSVVVNGEVVATNVSQAELRNAFEGNINSLQNEGFNFGNIDPSTATEADGTRNSITSLSLIEDGDVFTINESGPLRADEKGLQVVGFENDTLTLRREGFDGTFTRNNATQIGTVEVNTDFNVFSVVMEDNREGRAGQPVLVTDSITSSDGGKLATYNPSNNSFRNLSAEELLDENGNLRTDILPVIESPFNPSQVMVLESSGTNTVNAIPVEEYASRSSVQASARELVRRREISQSVFVPEFEQETVHLSLNESTKPSSKTLRDHISVKGDRPVEKKAETIITEAGVTLGYDQVHVTADGHLSLNGNALEAGKSATLQDGTVINFDGREAFIDTQGEYDVTVRRDELEGNAFLRVLAQTGEAGVLADGFAPTGILGESFDADSIEENALKQPIGSYRRNSLF